MKDSREGSEYKTKIKMPKQKIEIKMEKNR
jgi:hypothetical protein